MHVDDVVETILQRLCIRQQDTPAEADGSMSLVELRLALGVTEALMTKHYGCSRSRVTSASPTPPRGTWHWVPTGRSAARGRKRRLGRLSTTTTEWLDPDVDHHVTRSQEAPKVEASIAGALGSNARRTRPYARPLTPSGRGLDFLF